MLILILVAMLAGALSVLTPCVLPLLPALLVAGEGTRRRAIGIVAGLVSSFVLALLVLGSIVSALGLSDNILRYVAAALLIGFGLVLGIPKLRERFELAASSFSARLPQRAAKTGSGDGFASGLVLGAGLGLVWAPCVGPLVAGIAAAVASSGAGLSQVFQAAAFGLGMSAPLLAIVLGGQVMNKRIRRRVSFDVVHKVSAVVLILTGMYIALGLDVRVNKWLAQNTSLTSTPIAGLEQRTVKRHDAQTQRSVETTPGQLQHLGPAPEIDAAGPWIGSEALTIKELRGKVVLVDFWTYSCINCLRTIPYLNAWDQRYRDDGLVIIGIHTPEFSFEQDLSNVTQARSDLEIKYPVAQDNDYKVWRAYDNHYWPAHYLIDKKGEIRSVKFGEGDYDKTEQEIRQLLGEGADSNQADTEPVVDEAGSDEAIDLTGLPQTPETYLGAARAERFADGSLKEGLQKFAPHDRPLDSSQWSLAGSWRVQDERAEAVSGGSLSLRYSAAKVFLVMGSLDGKQHAVTYTDGGKAQKSVNVGSQKLYTLRDATARQDGLMQLEIPAGVAVYAFTFG